jgi:hypothetical protein
MPTEEDTRFDRRQSDHDLLIRVDAKLERVIADLAAMATDTKQTIKDHDGRIDSLEKWRWYLVGLATAAGAIAGIIGPRLF